jgi:hypothetical protein
MCGGKIRVFGVVFLVLVDEVLKYEVLWYSSVGMAGVGK